MTSFSYPVNLGARGFDRLQVMALRQVDTTAHGNWKIGDTLGASDWMRIDQAQIDAFGALTEDLEPLHNDPTWCMTNSPYRKPIAYGFLTLSLLTKFIHEATADAMRGHTSTKSYPLNYGFDRVRFVAPVVVGNRIRAHFTLGERKQRSDGDLLRIEVKVEIEGQDRPALVADWLTMWVTEPVESLLVPTSQVSR